MTTLSDLDVELLLSGTALPEDPIDRELMELLDTMRVRPEEPVPAPSYELDLVLAGLAPLTRTPAKSRRGRTRRALTWFAGLGVGVQLAMGTATAATAVGMTGAAGVLPSPAQHVFDDAIHHIAVVAPGASRAPQLNAPGDGQVADASFDATSTTNEPVLAWTVALSNLTHGLLGGPTSGLVLTDLFTWPGIVVPTPPMLVPEPPSAPAPTIGSEPPPVVSEPIPVPVPPVAEPSPAPEVPVAEPPAPPDAVEPAPADGPGETPAPNSGGDLDVPPVTDPVAPVPVDGDPLVTDPVPSDPAPADTAHSDQVEDESAEVIAEVAPVRAADAEAAPEAAPAE